MNKAARMMLYCIGHRPALPHPLESMLVRARTVTVSGACLALTNILNKVYSERSCLTCVLNNIAPSSLLYFKQKRLLNRTNLKDFIQVLICISIRICRIQIISDLMKPSVWMDSCIRHAFGVRVYEDILRGLLEEARYKPHTVHISLLCYNPSKG